ncbi:MAG TPA: sigma 54-interacting transcriptional regulator [Planctomycetota bacterium]|nr:sigma 54-interacting transcriptional regulator [Planctomycetota bacterium]
MADERSTSPADVAGDLNELARLAADDGGMDALLRRGLDWVARIAPCDLACVFLLDGDRLVLRAARGPLAPKVQGHALSLDAFPSLRETLESRRARAFLEDDHAHGDGDPFDGVLDLPPGHACMVSPLAAGERLLGALTLDRGRCEAYPESTVQLVELFCRLLGLAMLNAERSALLAASERRQRRRAELLDEELGGDRTEAFEATESPAMRDLARRARQVAPTATPVLVLGETGVGKERLARALHRWSGRGDKPFVKLNCAAVPGALLESELFGHVKGAFTGASQARLGRFQAAHGGTLLLDEIGDLPLELQAKLLRVLQEGELEPVGGDATVRVDVRVIAATHVDLERAVAEKRFREDLWYRLNVFPLRVPPLREREEDLPRLAAAVLDEQARRTGRTGMRLTPAALAKLRGRRWPGNVRELANVLERAVILTSGVAIPPEAIDLPEAGVDGAGSAVRARDAGGPPSTLDDAQREHIRRALAAADGRIYGKNGAAARLGMKPSTLQSRMKKLGVDKP